MTEPPPGVHLQHFGEPTRPPRRWRKYARKSLPVLAVLAGTAVLAGSVWEVADTVWERGDDAPVVLPNTMPTTTPAPYPVSRVKPVEQAPPRVYIDGEYRVGPDIAPGRYRAYNFAGAIFCSVIVRTMVDGEAILRTYGMDGTDYFDVLPSDHSVDIDGCPRYRRVS